MRLDTSSKLGRPPVQQERVLSDLTGRIVNGEFGESGRLPTRRELCLAYNVSQITIQQVLDQLSREGFVEARGTLGTFVSEKPPHLCNYAVVFPAGRDAPTFNRFWIALEKEARQFNGFDNRSVRLWHGIDGHADNEDFQRLTQDVKRKRLAGIIFASVPYLLEGSPLLEEPGIPRVAIMEPLPTFSASVGTVCPEGRSFIRKAVDHLISKGRKKIALLLPSVIPSEPWIAEIRRHGIEMPRYLVQHANINDASVARNMIHLMMRVEKADRPDGLIIADDNLVEYATAGLVDAGVRTPEEIEVVVHCNFPWPTASVVPSRRLGYDARAVLKSCFGLLDDMRRGEAKTLQVDIPAIFEDELKR